MRLYHSPLLWPLLVGVLSLAITASLWQHERQTQERNLRSHFDFGLRQTATRIEERLAGYEQMLRGVRGLFDASDEVTHDDFRGYVDALQSGSDFAGLRAIGHAALRPGGQAPVIDVAPAAEPPRHAIGADALADPVLRAAMVQSRDSGSIAITSGLRLDAASLPGPSAGFMLFMPLYAKGRPHDTVAARRDNVIGWVFASFRIVDLMSSLYGEATPGLEVQIHDGVDVQDATRLYPAVASSAPTAPARYQAHEFIGFAGHTWTLSVRSNPAFEQQFSNDAAQVIAVAGGALSLALALLTWQLVTARDRAHAAAQAMTNELRDSAERYRRIVETADEGIWLVGAEGRTTFVNPKMQRLLGRAADELLGRLWLDFMDDDGRAAMAGEGLARLKNGQPEHRDIGFLRHDGSALWASVSMTPIRDASGQYAGALAMVTDITERRLSEARRVQLEGQLRQSQKMEAIGTLAGGIAHDFNNIVAAILGNVELVRQDLGAGHPAAPRLAQIAQAGIRGRSLVQQIVAFSRRQPQERVNQPLRPLLEETVWLLRSTLPALVDIELRAADPSLQVSADATQLQQVLMNLGTNAWHAMTGGTGRIVIGMEAVTLDMAAAERLGGLTPGRHAHVWVSDDGCGMDEATRLRVFEPFFTTKPVGQGTGLGLSVVHGIVRSHGGAITVDSAPGRGSSFDMYFPLAVPLVAKDADAAAAHTAAPTPPQGQGEHVLYIDDDPVMAVMVQALLQRHGWRVTTIAEPRLALARLRELDADVDLVVTDFNMPELSGLDLARELGRIRPGLPVILTSGFVSENLRHDALAAGVAHVLQKEYTLEQLPALVQRTLRPRAGEGALTAIA